MSRVYDFLQECRTFFVATTNGNAPAVRPFGAVREFDGELYFTTANTKNVYVQLIENPHIQIVAHKTGTRDWIRIDGKAVEVFDLGVKQKMLDACPGLVNKLKSNDCNFYALFKIVEMKSVLHTNNGTV